MSDFFLFQGQKIVIRWYFSTPNRPACPIPQSLLHLSGSYHTAPPRPYPQHSQGAPCEAPTATAVLKITNIDAKHAVFRLFGVSLREKQEILFNKVYLLQKFSMTVTTQLVETITKGIQEKKGQDIVIVDLSQIDGAIANISSSVRADHPHRWRLLPSRWAKTAAKAWAKSP